MCGICGVAVKGDEENDPSLVLEMLAEMRSRGPDGCGIHAAGEVAYAATPEALAAKVPPSARAARVLLAQSRLAITGSRAARQPFVSADGRLALAHNGEAYNHREYATALGVDVPTGCDTEVLMRALEEHFLATGDLPESVRRTVEGASGMYALAATDGDTLVLERDAIGKKPLYYVDGPRRLAFASERKALARVAAEEDAPIVRLAPGERLTMDAAGAVRVELAERLSAPALDVVDAEQAIATYAEALDRSIARRTRGIERAAVFFSGGVDSVLVALLVRDAGVEVTGYAAGVEGAPDLAYAERVAREIGIPLKTCLVDAETLEADLPAILRAAELHGPVQAEVSVPMWYAAKAAHEDGHRVVFTGQAADELFAGYPWYRNVVRDHGALTLHARLWEDVRMLPLDTLEREDRISMAWSLEARAPFLDADVVRAAMRTLPTLKLLGPDDAFGKRPHRDLALRKGVPHSVAYREKAMAQDGANVHDLLRKVAEKRFPKRPPEADVPDFGSNYRYRDTLASYGSPEVRALLAAVVEEHDILVADADGSARPRRRVVRPVQRASIAETAR